MGVMGDIGIYVFGFVEFVLNDSVILLCGELNMYVEGCWLDDDGVVFIKIKKGVLGVLIVL